ncbi:hypothetical protein C8Q75DRAFT_805576 [Abortiporus biennis]|nr:hypothetical protein C8Q75DRAFT_805576 [Abortiporus biennis]
MSPTLAYPVAAQPVGYHWGIPPQPVPATEYMTFNWGYPPPQFIPSSAVVQPQAQSQPPQFRPLSWRTTLCRHYIKNQGWCPLGDECGYIHDLSLAAHAHNDIRFPDSQRSGRGSNNRGRAGSKHSHCWAYVQGLCRVKDCPYLHPVAVNLFVPHTPCLAWPNCSRGALCAYKHPEPLMPKMSDVLPPPPPPAQPQQKPPSPILVIPTGSLQYQGTQYQGTTYFPVSSPGGIPQVQPAPVGVSQPSPHYTWTTYSPIASAPSGYSPYSPESNPFPSPYYETGPSLPPVTVAQQTGSSYTDGNMYPNMRFPVQMSEGTWVGENQDVEEKTPTATYKESTDSEVVIEEFPYKPPTQQRPGHARRISVALKSKDDCDALGLDSPSQTPTRVKRESWMRHSQRDAPTHRSWPWAPDNFGLQTASQLVII